VISPQIRRSAGDEVRVARVLSLHEDAVPAEDGRGAVTLRHVRLPKSILM